MEKQPETNSKFCYIHIQKLIAITGIPALAAGQIFRKVHWIYYLLELAFSRYF